MIDAVFMLGEIRAFFMLILGGGDTWKAGSIEYYSFDAETGTSAIGYRGYGKEAGSPGAGPEYGGGSLWHHGRGREFEIHYFPELVWGDI